MHLSVRVSPRCGDLGDVAKGKGSRWKKGRGASVFFGEILQRVCAKFSFSLSPLPEVSFRFLGF